MPVNTVHRWANQGSSTVRALAEITPASEGFERGLPILYGLAGDGVSTSQGVPRDPLVAAWIMELTDMRLPGVSRVAGPVIHALAQRARARGLDRELEERYCRWRPARRPAPRDVGLRATRPHAHEGWSNPDAASSAHGPSPAPRQPPPGLRQHSPPRRPSRGGPDRGAPRRFPAPSHR